MSLLICVMLNLSQLPMCHRQTLGTHLIYVHNDSVKEIVHPKMKILSSFTPPQVFPNLYECLCSAEHKERYSEECGKQSSSGAPLWKSMVLQNSPVTNFLQTIPLKLSVPTTEVFRPDITGSWISLQRFSSRSHAGMRSITSSGSVAIFTSERPLAHADELTNHIKVKIAVTTKS